MMPIIEIENLLSASKERANAHLWDSQTPLFEAQANYTDSDSPEQLHALVSSALAHVRQAQQQICEREMRIRFLESSSTTDELTGLWNKRGFVLMAQKMFSFARHYDEKGLVALIEVERLDDEGQELHHSLSMERLVRGAGSILLSRFPDPCVVARIDPCIFGIVLPTSQIEDCRLWLVDEIKQAIREATVGYQANLSFRVNLGTADYHANSVLEDVLEAAELRMEQSRVYQAYRQENNSLEEALRRRQKYTTTSYEASPSEDDEAEEDFEMESKPVFTLDADVHSDVRSDSRPDADSERVSV